VAASYKVFNLIAAVIFAVFSSLQWNDLEPAVYDDPSITDAVAWAVFYALVAVLFIYVLLRRLPRWVFFMAAVFCLVQMGRTATGLWDNITGDGAFSMAQANMSADDPRVERTRELFGALIALLGVGIIAFKNTRWARPTDSPSAS